MDDAFRDFNTSFSGKIGSAADVCENLRKELDTLDSKVIKNNSQIQLGSGVGGARRCLTNHGRTAWAKNTQLDGASFQGNCSNNSYVPDPRRGVLTINHAR